MVIPDINLLVFSYNEEAPRHGAAREWWEGLMTGREAVGIPWVVVLGFMRLVTHPAVLEAPCRRRRLWHGSASGSHGSTFRASILARAIS